MLSCSRHEHAPGARLQTSQDAAAVFRVQKTSIAMTRAQVSTLVLVKWPLGVVKLL